MLQSHGSFGYKNSIENQSFEPLQLPQASAAFISWLVEMIFFYGKRTGNSEYEPRLITEDALLCIQGFMNRPNTEKKRI